MSDLISREKLLEELGEEPLVWNDTDEELTERNMWRWFRSIVESAPSVEQSGYVTQVGEWRKINDE